MNIQDNAIEVFNFGLSQALEFGANYRSPIHERLALQFPELLPQDLDQIDKLCSEVRDYSNQLIYTTAGLHDEKACKSLWGEQLNTRYQWINEVNLGRLFSQGMYYAWVDGVVKQLVGQEATLRKLNRNQTTYAYDERCDCRGRITKVIDALGRFTESRFDAAGRSVTSIDEKGRETRFEYDSRGRLTRTLAPDNTITSQTYDAVNRVIARTDQTGKVTRYKI